jgi:hypothetical protein
MWKVTTTCDVNGKQNSVGKMFKKRENDITHFGMKYSTFAMLTI